MIRPNQVWVSDITYIKAIKGFCYLALITDVHSRKIVGYDLSDCLELKGSVRALNKAIYQAKDINGAINLYNEIRLHLSLDYKTPNMVYLKTAYIQL